MTPAEFVKKIRNYAVVSFFVPLIAINSCLLIYKYLGDLKISYYPNLNWNQDEHTYSFEEFKLKLDDRESHRFNFCPKHEYFIIYTSIDNQILTDTKPNQLIIGNLINTADVISNVIYYFLLFLLRALLFFEPIFLRPLCFFGYPIFFLLFYKLIDLIKRI